MKRHIYIFALLLAVSCSKTEINYDSPSEIVIAPVAEGMTKAAIAGGDAPIGQTLAVWANYETVENTTATAGSPYLSEALFVHKDGVWTGQDYNYFWPKQGTLSFAGCSVPAEGNGEVAYDYPANTISVTGFKQPASTAQSLDMMWFNKTAGQNNSSSGANLQVEMKHALAWITVQAYGKDASKQWVITELAFDNVVLGGHLVCKTTGPTWTITETTDDTKTNTDNDVLVYSGSHALGDIPKPVETVENGTLLVPQKPKTLKVSYKTNPSSSVVTHKDLDFAEGGPTQWEAGKHYIYTILFNPYKISFSVKTESLTWGVVGDKVVNEYDDHEINP